MNNERFDKFTERARKVLTLAQEEATRFNHNYIGTEHLLLGLVREGDGVAAQVLRSLGVELNRVRSAVEFIIGRGDRMIVGEVGLTPRAKKVIELAVDEARRLGHHYIGTEHLLLGLVREGEGIAAGVLESLGVNLERVRRQTIQVLSQGQAAENAAGPEPQGSSESVTQEVQHLLESVPGVLGMQSVPAVLHGRRVHWDYLVAEVEYPQGDDPAAQAEHPRPEAIGLIKRFLGTEEARAGLHGKPVAEVLRILGAEGWELAAIDHPAPEGGPSGHYYVFKLATMRNEPSLHDTWAAIVAIDEGCRICAFNREAERITGLHAPEVLGRRFCHALWSMGCSASPERLGCPWQHAIQGHERRKHPREIMARIGERRIDVLLGARTTLTERGTPGALITFVDLTQRREMERVRNELVADVFHELHSPMRAISMAAHFLNADFDHLEPERVRSMLATIQHKAGQLLNDLNDLLNRSTFTVDAPGVTPMPLQLDPVVDQVIWKLEPLLAQRGQRARKAYAFVPDVLADERRIEQVLVNLLTNANKYSVEGDELVIDAAVQGDSVLVSVEDHGPGIDPQDRAHIFDRFYRGGHTAESASGAGLGLAIVRTIVEAHKGHVGVEDVHPRGARFWFTLPLA